MSVMVLACYRPKSGKESDLMALMKTHLPILREEGLVGDGPSLCGKAKDGTLVEVFCWKSQDAIDTAHENPQIQSMWGKFSEVCDFVSIGDVEGANNMFTALEPVDLS